MVERKWCRVCRMFGLVREVLEGERMLLLLILRAVWVLGLRIGFVVENGRVSSMLYLLLVGVT